MDLELLNYLVVKFEFVVSGDELSLVLPACDEDKNNNCIFPLSNNADRILTFFGYDMSVNLNHLTEKSLFNYLVSSKKLIYVENLKPAKNAQHQRFAKFVKSHFETEDNPTPESIRQMKDAAIAFFEKKREFQIYEYQYKMLQRALEVRDKLKADEKTFSRFMKLHGMNTVIKADDEELFHRWSLFAVANWTLLDFL